MEKLDPKNIPAAEYRRARLATGLSRVKTAAALGLNERTLRERENGLTRIRAEHILALAFLVDRRDKAAAKLAAETSARAVKLYRHSAN